MSFKLDTKQGRQWLIGTLRINKIRVTFTKKDGTERDMLCTLQEEAIIPYEKKTERVKEQNEEVLSVWDVEKNSWRSFRFDSIIRISFTI